MRARDGPLNSATSYHLEGGTMEYLEFDESEYLYYAVVSHITLDFICDMYGPEVRDMLLVPRVVKDVRLSDKPA